MLVLLGALNPALTQRAVWTLDDHGISTFSRTLPEWDFANTWGGGRLAAEGRALTVFDTTAYRAWFSDRFGPGADRREWSYPPHLLLISLILAQLPLLGSYLLWTVGTIAALWFVLRHCRMPFSVCWATALSPGVLISTIFGQTGAATAALFLGGLLLLERSPIVAGILIGVLTVKPQMGLLIPVCLIAGGHWRTFLVAALTFIAMALGTAVAFGWEAFQLYLQNTVPMMHAFLESPAPHLTQPNEISIFLSVRGLGADTDTAYAVQALAALAAAIAAWRLWRVPLAEPADRALRVGLTGCLALLATPYMHNYDMAVFSFAAALLLQRRGWRFDIPLLLCWFWPDLANFVNLNLFPVTPLVAGLLIWLGYRALFPAAPATSPAVSS